MSLISDDDDQVLTKEHNYRLWQGGAYGNKLKSWRTIEEWRGSGFAGLVVLRMRGKTGFQGPAPCAYNVAPEDVESVLDVWSRVGTDRSQVMVNEAAPDQQVILQGEYLNDIDVLDGVVSWGRFFYSRARGLHMRDALKAAPEISERLRSDLLLRLAMTPSSYDDWLLLLERFPGHVLEVSVYDRCLGDVPGRNALVWEVRKY